MSALRRHRGVRGGAGPRGRESQVPIFRGRVCSTTLAIVRLGNASTSCGTTMEKTRGRRRQVLETCSEMVAARRGPAFVPWANSPYRTSDPSGVPSSEAGRASSATGRCGLSLAGWSHGSRGQRTFARWPPSSTSGLTVVRRDAAARRHRAGGPAYRAERRAKRPTLPRTARRTWPLTFGNGLCTNHPSGDHSRKLPCPRPCSVECISTTRPHSSGPTAAGWRRRRGRSAGLRRLRRAVLGLNVAAAKFCEASAALPRRSVDGRHRRVGG